MSLTAAQVSAVPVPIKGETPQCRWVKISPELAMRWLEGEVNHNNRTIRDAHVRRLSEDMKQGRWRGMNGEAIRFDGKGRLVDGQHRLWACVVANVSFDSLVIDDVDEDDYSTIGIGAKKSLADFLGPMGGEKNVHLLASAIRLVYLWQHRLLGNMKDGKSFPTIAELEITLRDHPNIRDSVNTLSGMSATRRLLNPTYGTLIHYAGTLENKSASVHSFLERLGTGLGLEADDPVYHLRKFLLSQQGPAAGHRRPGKQYMLALAIKAWNFSKKNERIKALIFRVDETFPAL